MSNNRTTFFLPREEQIVITFNGLATGYIANIGNPGDAPTEFTTVHASDVVTLGPFNDPKNYEINLVNGSFTSSAPQFLGAVDDDSAKEDHSALAAIAESGAASDATYDHTTSMLTATDVQAAIDELVVDLAGKEATITPGTFIASPSTIGETALKTAVDAIRALLIAKGIMAAS